MASSKRLHADNPHAQRDKKEQEYRRKHARTANGEIGGQEAETNKLITLTA